MNRTPRKGGRRAVPLGPCHHVHHRGGHSPIQARHFAGGILCRSLPSSLRGRRRIQRPTESRGYCLPRGDHRERGSREETPRHSRGALPSRRGRGFRFRFRYRGRALHKHLARFRPQPRRSTSHPLGPRLRTIYLGGRQDNWAGGECGREPPRRLPWRWRSAPHEEGDARVSLRLGPGSDGVPKCHGAGPGRRHTSETGCVP